MKERIERVRESGSSDATASAPDGEGGAVRRKLQPEMKAVFSDAYGSAEVLRERMTDVPSVDADDVLIEVKAASIHRGTWHLMTGLPYVIRLGFGFSRPKEPIPGDECSGVVVAVGESVTRFQPGDEVLGVARGSLAQFAVASESSLVAKPEGLSFVEAAATPISAATALEAIRDVGAVGEGDEVLIIGASGAVGSYAVQLGKHYGGRVTGVCSTKKLDYVRSLGADAVIDYTTTDLGSVERRFDVIVDIGGNRPTAVLRKLLDPDGTLVFVGGEEGGRWIGGIHRQIGASLMSRFTRQSMRMFFSDPNAEMFQDLLQLYEDRAFVPPVDRVFSLSQTADAMRYLSAGHPRGKVAISVE